MSDHRHEAGGMRQSNKGHKTRHRSKKQLNARGRVELARASGKKKAALARDARRLKSDQVRRQKREKTQNEKRKLGGAASSAPHIIMFFQTYSVRDDARAVRDLLAIEAGVDPEDPILREEVVTTYAARLRRRISLVAAPRHVQAALEYAKIADSVVLVGAPDGELDDEGDLFMSCLKAQGVPTTTHILTNLDVFTPKEQKKKNDLKRDFARTASDQFPDTKVHYLEKEGDARTCLWSIVNRKRRKLAWREHRAHLLPTKTELEGDELRVTGFIRGSALNANALVHIPGVGACPIRAVLHAHDPLTEQQAKGTGSRKMKKGDILQPGTVLAEPAPELQHSLETEVEVDPLDAEQTFPTDEEIDQAVQERALKMDIATRKVKVPKGWSNYQASWIVEDDDGEDENEASFGNDKNMAAGADDEDDYDVEREIFAAVGKTHIPRNNADSDEDGDGDGENEGMHEALSDDDDEEERVIVGNLENEEELYDKEVDMDEEKENLEKLRAAREDQMFPDEVDTPLDTPARVRFAKYRGLSSFRHTEWNPLEELPEQYARIFKFQNFKHTQNRIKKYNAAGVTDEEDEPYLVSEGTYCTVCIGNVPADFDADPAIPFVVWALWEHENKMTVVNYAIRVHDTFTEPIKSKERLTFCTGTRTFSAQPIFSEFVTGNKHKFLRYMQPGDLCVATVIAPVQFAPMPVLCFKEQDDGTRVLVATGSVMSINPDRIVVKRIRLSGHPYKINKRSAVIRYMFFSPADIYWFKPIELTTKYGRRGHIKQSLGTHGHMKCVFDSQLKAQDTVLMSLYKRVFPKWTFQECPSAAHEYTALCYTEEDLAASNEEMDDADD